MTPLASHVFLLSSVVGGLLGMVSTWESYLICPLNLQRMSWLAALAFCQALLLVACYALWAQGSRTNMSAHSHVLGGQLTKEEIVANVLLPVCLLLYWWREGMG